MAPYLLFSRLESLVVPKLLFYVAAAGSVLSAIVGLLRLLDQMWAGHYTKVLVPVITVLAAAYALTRADELRVDPLSGTLSLLAVFGLIVGLAGGAATPYYVLTHALAAVFGLFLYAASANAEWDEQWLELFIEKLCIALLAAYTLVLFAFWTIVLVFGKALYLGIGTGDLMLPLAFYLMHRRWRVVLLTVCLVILSGKRGTYVAIAAVLLFWLPFPLVRSFGGRIALVAVGMTGLALVSFLVEDVLRSLPIPLAAWFVLDKWFLLNPFNPEFDFSLASSGRSEELRLAFEPFVDSITPWLVGLGWGWSYFYDAEVAGSDTTDFYAQYVHISPLNYVLLYGLPAAMIVLYFMYRIAGRAYRVAVERGSSVLSVLVLAWVGSFAQSISGYALATDPLFWLLLGTAASLSRRGRRQTLCAA